MTLEQRKKKVKQKGGSLPRGWDEGGSGGRREMGSLSKARSQVPGRGQESDRQEKRTGKKDRSTHFQQSDHWQNEGC